MEQAVQTQVDVVEEVSVVPAASTYLGDKETQVEDAVLVDTAPPVADETTDQPQQDPEVTTQSTQPVITYPTAPVLIKDDTGAVVGHFYPLTQAGVDLANAKQDSAEPPAQQVTNDFKTEKTKTVTTVDSSNPDKLVTTVETETSHYS